MSRVLSALLSAIFLFGSAEAATGGGKGKLGSVADSGHGTTGGGGSHTGRMPRDPRSAPPLEEKRKVSEQDCSKPIDPQAGNLRCK